MLQKADCLGVNQLVDHIAEDSSNGEEAFIGMTNVSEACLVKKDLLHDENCDCFRQFRACFHDSETEWNDLRRKEEVNDSIVVVLLVWRVHVKRCDNRGRSTDLNQCTNNSQ